MRNNSEQFLFYCAWTNIDIEMRENTIVILYSSIGCIIAMDRLVSGRRGNSFKEINWRETKSIKI
jgi:hypothetical protein